MNIRPLPSRNLSLICCSLIGLACVGSIPANAQPTLAPSLEQLDAEQPATVEAVPPDAEREAGVETNPAEDSNQDDPSTTGHSDAERVAELQESIEHDVKQLESLEAELDNPESEYALADKEFRALNDDYDQTQEQLELARKSSNADVIQKLEQDLASLERQRKLAEDRFDLAIEDRKTLREERATLRSKIEKDKAALAELTGENELDAATENDPKKDEASSGSKSDEPKEEESDSESTSSTEEKSASDEVETDEEIKQAAAEAEEKAQEAEEAQEETQSIAARLADIQRLVSQEQKELNLARKKVDLATASQLTLSQELSRREAEQADAADLNELRASISKVSQRLIQARAEVSEVSERLNDHRAELSSLQAEHIVALHEAEKKRHEAANAEQHVESLRNPWTVRNILQWIIEHGPRLLAIALGMFLINRLASFFAYRSVRLVTTSTGRGSTVERENRAKTLVGVFQNAATVAIFISGTMMMLEEVGANITVLMGGVAVIGLAVAFGAQNLIKDYFYGFVMLLENQYMLNDSVRIGGVVGLVERITLRMTVLRDSNGVVHFIPNGTINSVSNETHGWSRAVCEIAVGYHEDIDRVAQVLKGVSQELQADATVGRFLLEPPTEPAIESLGESAIHFKVAAKTSPNKHGAVKQEWLRRIKNRFEEMGISPPMQERLIHVSGESQNGQDVSPISNRIRRAG